jgi:acyl carrier protein
MNEQEIRAAILKALTSVAPNVDAEAIDPAVNFRDQFDFDSMDYLNFVITLNQALGVDIPEIDYPKLSSLDGSVAYLKAMSDRAA